MGNLNLDLPPSFKPPKAAFSDLHRAAMSLAASDDYRVLRRLVPQRLYGDAAGRPLLRGVIIDTETTGIDRENDIITELAMLPFTYTDEGEVIEVFPDEGYHGLQDPGRRISETVTRKTGHTNESLRGRQLNVSAIHRVLEPADLLVAHHASFDRCLLERLTGAFARKVWGCSMAQVPWDTEGMMGAKLEYLVLSSGYFFEAHQAMSDCQALLHLLAMPLPKSDRMPLDIIRGELRRSVYSIWLANTPYGSKDAIKRLGFRWVDRAGTKGWSKLSAQPEVREVLRDVREIYQRYRIPGEPSVQLVDVKDFFTDRAAPGDMSWPMPLAA